MGSSPTRRTTTVVIEPRLPRHAPEPGSLRRRLRIDRRIPIPAGRLPRRRDALACPPECLATPKSAWIRSTQEIIARVKSAISGVAARGAGEIGRPGCVELYSNWKHWICLFPQHGAGPKHARPIRLEAWQERSILLYPGQFLAGLIHSDGCRCLNRVKGHDYPRYFFSNRSAEIRALFAWACNLVEVSCRADGPRNVSVAQRESVSILDQLVGGKH